MDYLLNNLDLFITEQIKYCTLTGNSAPQKLLSGYLAKLKEEITQIRDQFESDFSHFSSEYPAQLYVSRHYSAMVHLIETLLFYLCEIKAEIPSPQQQLLIIFYNEVCHELENLLWTFEQFDH